MTDSDLKYREFVHKINFRELRIENQNVYKLKYQMFKIEAKKRWTQAKGGAKFGFIAGGLVGLVLGMPSAVKARQPSVCLMSGLASALFFATISGLGTIIRQ